MRITADEARALLTSTVQSIVDEVYLQIEIAAKNNKRYVHLYGEFWSKEAYGNTSPWLEAKQMLENDGYVVKVSYNPTNAIVDVFTSVEW
jgi:propanediol utilization protein